MPRIQASISLPYLLKLASGSYPSGPRGVALEIWEPNFLPDVVPRTLVSITADQPDTEDPTAQRQLNFRQADQLVDLTNRLLRGYRALTHDSSVIELSRAGASPFRFRVVSEGLGLGAWDSELSYPAELPKALRERTETITQSIRELLASGSEPDVGDLFVLDAERALHEGRFREAVLFCWSTIDSTFSRKYDDLVDSKLVGEWAEARDFFKGVDFGLKKKMSAALYLVSGRSLFRESGDLWEQLSISYNKRNGIIHRGESASEDDARRAIEVARRVVAIMSAL
jgi:hypothetical protein